MRLIDADALLKAIIQMPLDGNVFDRIHEAPTIEPQRKKGRWIERKSGTEDKEYGFETVIVCSHCDFQATTFYSEDCESRTQIRTDFCPNCGADMREDGEADEAD